jgi:DNA (cytosine-5)-methyltransferase 1
MTTLPELNYTSVEVFAGGGGLALGLRHAGFSHNPLIERNPNAIKVLAHNARRDPRLWHEEDVVADDVQLWHAKLPRHRPEVELVAGGPPCQPFSLSGAHAGENDHRNMFPAALDVVRALNPKLVVFENVPGLTRPSFSPYFEYVKAQLHKPAVRPRDGEMWWEHANRVARARTATPAYSVHQELIDAADLGVPQSRRRVFLIAIRTDIAGHDTWNGVQRTHHKDALLYDQWVDNLYWTQYDLPQPTTPDKIRGQVERLKRQGRPDALRWRTIRDALHKFPSPVDGQEHDKIANHIGIPGARTYKKHTGSPYDWPSKTIKAGVHGVCGGEGMIRYPDGQLRYFTIREAALMQGFPLDYEFPGTRSRVMEIIGNAVAVPVAQTIGTLLAGMLSADNSAEDVA